MFIISIVTLCYGSYKLVISSVSQIQASVNLHNFMEILTAEDLATYTKNVNQL